MAESVTPRINFRLLSGMQRDVLGAIAINQDRGHHPATAKSLEKRGLIESRRETLGGFPPIMITRYSMPLWVHIQWCAFCSEELGR